MGRESMNWLSIKSWRRERKRCCRWSRSSFRWQRSWMQRLIWLSTGNIGIWRIISLSWWVGSSMLHGSKGRLEIRKRGLRGTGRRRSGWRLSDSKCGHWKSSNKKLKPIWRKWCWRCRRSRPWKRSVTNKCNLNYKSKRKTNREACKVMSKVMLTALWTASRTPTRWIAFIKMATKNRRPCSILILISERQMGPCGISNL